MLKSEGAWDAQSGSHSEWESRYGHVCDINYGFCESAIVTVHSHRRKTKYTNIANSIVDYLLDGVSDTGASRLPVGPAIMALLRNTWRDRSQRKEASVSFQGHVLWVFSRREEPQERASTSCAASNDPTNASSERRLLIS